MDSQEQVDANRSRFLSALRLEGVHFAALHQIHSDRIYIVDEVSGERYRSEGDALVTQLENVALAVQTADCLPILLADPTNNAVAAVHSGWKGTLSRILFKTIREMQRAFNSDPARLLAAIGPGIRACCFEVGAEVSVLFEKEYPGRGLAKPKSGATGKSFVDLVGALEIQLSDAGVLPGNCYDLGACTCCNTDKFFSYRAEGPASGRMLAVIGRIPGRSSK